jgi:hypothetical protein
MKLNAFSSVDRPTIAKFTDLGDSYTGTIATEPEWRDDPFKEHQQMLVIVIECGNGVFYQINGRTQMPDAIRDAMVDANCEELEPGGQLTVTYTRDAGNAKIYAAVYVPPAAEKAPF